MSFSVLYNQARIPALFGIIALASSATPAASNATNAAGAPHRSVATKAALVASYGKLPLSFEANQGQTDPSVKFLSRGSGYSLFLTDSGAVLTLRKGNAAHRSARPLPASHTRIGALPSGRPPDSETWESTNPKAPAVTPVKTDVVRMELAGASRAMQIAGAEQLPGTANYFIGNDPAKWHTGVPTYAKVRYSGVYPGVDLVYYGSQRQLEYDFIVAPGASPKPIRLQFAGAKALKLTPAGDLIVSSTHGQIAFHKPAIYQERNGQRQPVEGRFQQLAGNAIGFRLGAYDRSRPLVIDPVLTYSTFLGGSYYDSGAGIAVDGLGDAYITGQAGSADFPVTKGAFQTVNKGIDGGTNAFVTKLNPTGTALVYSTYLGGSGGDGGSGIAVDAMGDAYVTGGACSTDFPTTKGAFQTVNKAAGNQGCDGFVSKVDPTGSALVYSTYLGGSGNGPYNGDFGSGIAVDGLGDAYVTGSAGSTNFPVTAGAFQTANKGTIGPNAFVTKFNPTGTALIYSTYLGGKERDHGNGIAVDGSGDAYVTGVASSFDFPTTKGAYQKLNKCTAVPTATAFVTMFNPAGTAPVYSTYLGGSGGDKGYGVAIDGLGNAYVTGLTNSTDFPTTKGAFQTVNNGATNQFSVGFVTKLNPTGTALVYSTYLGGSAPQFALGDWGAGIAVDGSGDAFVTGQADSVDFPTTEGAFQSVNKGTDGGTNAFVTRLNPSGTALAYSTYLGGSGFDWGSGIAVDVLGDAYVIGQAGSLDFPTTKGAFQTVNGAADWTAFVTKLDLGATTQVATAATLGASANPAPPGAAVTFTAAVASSNLNGASPTGSAAFAVDGKTVATAAVSAGKATFTTSNLALGKHSVQASYDDSSSYFAPSSANLTETIEAELQAATPVIKPGTGAYTTVQKVTITDTTPSAIILYALGGAPPSTSTTKYTGPFTISSSNIVKAIAVATGYANSATASAVLTVNLPTAAKPTFSPAGGTYPADQSVEIKDATAGAIIYYTTDGKAPTTSSSVYTKAIAVSANETIEAIAGGENFLPSAVAIANYAITPPAAAPVIKPGTGTYSAAQKVTITDTTPNSTIYYTLNGEAPTISGTKYTGAITVPLSAHEETIKAIAVAPGFIQSAVATATYTMTPLVATPTFSPKPGTYSNPVQVTISDKTKDTAIYYTLNGKPPTTSSARYINTPIQVNSSETIESLGVSGGNDSLVGTGTYTITPGITAPPTITTTPAQNGAVVASLSTTTADYAIIYYTTNGTTPTTASPQYLAPILIASNMKLSAIATVPGYATSPVASQAFTPNIPSDTLVWSDEFTNTAGANAQPNPNVWTYDTGVACCGNNEWEDYCAWGSTASPCDPTHPNTYVGTDGYLHIIARNPIAGTPAPGSYTSARLKTQGLFSFQYGRFEARILVPEAQGLWPAGWLLGNNIATVNWPACGEQDVQERIDSAGNPDWNAGSIHAVNLNGSAQYQFPSGQTAAQWHTYGMIWKDGIVSLYVDDPATPYVTYKASSYTGTGAIWPFDGGQANFIILNLAVGGDWPGPPNGSTPFPSEMLVDYVRVYTN